MALQQMVLSAGGGVAEYDTWADLPASASGGDEAVVGGTLYIYRAAAGLWLPWYLPGTTRDARSWSDEGDLTVVTAGGWTVNDAVATTKVDGQPLNITGSGVGIALSCTPPTANCTLVFKDLTALGVGSGLTSSLWGYFARDNRLFEFLFPNATSASVRIRNPGTGAQIGRAVTVGASGVFAVAIETAGATGQITVWSPDDADGYAQYYLDMYGLGSDLWRFYRSISGTSNTSFNLEVLT